MVMYPGKTREIRYAKRDCTLRLPPVISCLQTWNGMLPKRAAENTGLSLSDAFRMSRWRNSLSIHSQAFGSDRWSNDALEYLGGAEFV